MRRNNSVSAKNVGMNHGPRQPTNVDRCSFTPSGLGIFVETSWNAQSTPYGSTDVDERTSHDDWIDQETISNTYGEPDLVNSMRELDIDGYEKARPAAVACEWRQSKIENVHSTGTERQQRTRAYSRATKPKQPLMSHADSFQSYTFHKDEFKRGMIFRAALHEEDYYVAPSNKSTARRFANNHQIMTDFGPVYSENRLMVVVVLGPDTYKALPFYTHSGNGTVYKQGKDDYVSVQDHRYPAKCIQQSIHKPVCTEIMKNKVKPLHELTTVHLGNSVSRKYRLPVQHQGQLCDYDTDRLVSLYKRWIMEH